MSDDEDYDSEADIDYVPSDGERGSEEENSGDEEDFSLLTGEGGTVPSKSRRAGKKKNPDLAPRKRKGGIKLETDEATPEDETNGDSVNTELAQKLKEEAAEKLKEKEKKRADDLWSSFMSDVKPITKPKPTQASSLTDAKQTAGSSSTSTVLPSPAVQSQSTPKPAAEKVTITTVFDFAGEEVKITKEVAADSKEAKAELKRKEESEQQTSADSAAPSSSSSLSSSLLPSSSSSLSSSLLSSRLGASSPASSALKPGGSSLGLKRPAAAGGGLGSVLGKIGKKNKMGTLEKSKMDWDSFKKKEGIDDDLRIHNKGKDGYIERMAFLNRADIRQYEIERDVRLNKSGKR